LKLIATLDRVPEKYFSHITNSTGIYEIRVEVQSNIFRVFSFFDKGKLVVVVNKHQRRRLNWQRNLKNRTSMKKNENKNLKSFTEHLDEQYGIRGNEEREKFEEGFEAFKLGVMLQELRKEIGMTQEQLAEK
jgi:hypothetical protein